MVKGRNERKKGINGRKGRMEDMNGKNKGRGMNERKKDKEGINGRNKWKE